MARLPTLFVSHGAPTFALEPGRAGPLLQAVGECLPRPKAVLVVSPHWITREIAVTASARPATIHDFGGFPDALYQLQYPAPGAPMLAETVMALLRDQGYPATCDPERGLDHGAWVPLRYLYPDAAVPVIQVSMPASLDPHSAWRLGQALAPLAEAGVLVVGSGSLTHNLYEFRMGSDEQADYAWEFVHWARQAVRGHDKAALMDYLHRAPHGRRAHPTPEHYLPLLVAAAAATPGGEVDVLEGGMSHGVLSMESYLFH
ncbi:DODA-type extradiol aromatic ring-opening family dioxygenase [Zobellella maritima]|uniref:DODA-type extradiol aromatic ring-opening family dioxygenase n=1 Tax=Zobellella maritima TaxID=2059725 RepID=UPI000E30479F|nr:class III extradiol ring-cleavage dioxygenase [Zobellella maritima]